MKIAIIGSRGVPNRYGGFEQFAEVLSTRLVEKGHQVTVYSPHFHPYQESTFEGVDIKHIYSPEDKMGALANFLYDYLSLRHAARQKHEILLQLGYGTSAASFRLVRLRGGKIITNMDGLEWLRDKWSPTVKKLTKYFEKVAVKRSHALVSDNEGIQRYLMEEYKAPSTYIAYSTKAFDNFDETPLAEYGLAKNGYYLVIARLEPENNVEIVINGYLESDAEEPLIIIGGTNTPHGKAWSEKYGGERVKFLGGVYNQDHLFSLRHYAKGYFHGHSVGGTNPSLLEAMGSKALIFCHDNPFNKSVVSEGHGLFGSPSDVVKLIKDIDDWQERKPGLIALNDKKITEEYTEERIVNQYEQMFEEILKK